MKEFALKIAAQSELIDTAPSAGGRYLVSAEPDVPGAVYAPQIAAAAAAGAPVSDLELLFEARARAYDYDSGAPLNAYVAPRVAVLSGDAALAAELAAAGFEVLFAPGAAAFGGVGELYIEPGERGVYAVKAGAAGATTATAGATTLSPHRGGENYRASGELATTTAATDSTADSTATDSTADSTAATDTTNFPKTAQISEIFTPLSGEQIISLAVADVRAAAQPAIICAHDFPTTAALIAALKARTGRINASSQIRFDEHICDASATRGGPFCTACADACPTVAIAQDGGAPIISQLDCVACARCVAACPSNALEFCALSRDALIATSELFAGRKLVLGVPERLAGALVFPAPLGLCDELLLLHLVQLSGHTLAICAEDFAAECGAEWPQPTGGAAGVRADFSAAPLAERVEFINALARACFGRDAIEILPRAEFAERADFSPHPQLRAHENNFRLNKKELLARKILAWINAAQSAGASLPEAIAYAGAHEVAIADNCTLCAACAGACKQGALLADAASNAISFNASLCTGCGYCAASCAEPGCITISHGQLRTDAAWFAPRILARDELFACAECGREFATRKAIERVASMLAPRFSADALREYSLYCCADCKGALMMLRQAAVADPSCFSEAEYAAKLQTFKEKKCQTNY